MAGETALATDPQDDIIVSGDVSDRVVATAVADAPPAEIPTEEPEPEPTEAAVVDPASEAGKQLAKKKGSLQERINELTREKHANKREADAAKSELAALRSELEALKKPAAAPAKTEPAADGKPKFRDYEAKVGTTYDTYADAIEAFNDDRDAWREKQSTEARKADEDKASRDTLVKTAMERIEAFRQIKPDYDDVVSQAYVPDGPGQVALLAHLQYSEFGPRLAYELAAKPAELARLASLPPPLVVEALGELKAELKMRETAAMSGPADLPAPKTKATPPIKPVSGSPVASDVDGDPDDLSEAAIAAHIRRENERDRHRRRR